MKLLELGMTNFLGFGPVREVVDFSEVGLYLICGENGVGKSTILDGISFAYYGAPVRNINLPKLVNEQVDKDCLVDLKFEVNGAIYWIERYRKHSKYKDALRIFKGTHDDEGLISKADSKDAQEQLDGIIKMNHKAFINTIMLTQEDLTGFIEGTPAKKKEIIESILQLDSFTKYHKIAQDKRKIKKAILDALGVEMKTDEKLEENIKKSMEDYVASCKAQMVKDKKTVASLKEQLEDLREIDVDHEFEQIRLKEELVAKQKQLLSDRQVHVDKTKALQKEQNGFTTQTAEYQSLIKSAKKRLDKIKSDTAALIARRNELVQKIAEAEGNPENCPFCGGEINVELHAQYIAEKRQESDTMKSQVVDAASNLEAEKTNISGWESKIAELAVQIGMLDASIKSESDESARIKREYDSIEIPAVRDAEDLQQIADNIKLVEVQIKAFENKEYVDKSYLATSKGKLTEVMSDLVRVREEYAKQLKEFQILQFWEDSLSSKKNSIKSWCINNIVGYFNARIKHFIDRFFEGRISIQFDNELNEVVKFKSYDRDFKQFSGGQRRRLNIATLFALHSLVKANVSNKIDIMFLDEILSNNLDDKGISVVLTLLEEMKDNSESVWVIDHRDNFKNFPAFRRVDVWQDKKEFSHIKLA